MAEGGSSPTKPDLGLDDNEGSSPMDTTAAPEESRVGEEGSNTEENIRSRSPPAPSSRRHLRSAVSESETDGSARDIKRDSSKSRVEAKKTPTKKNVKTPKKGSNVKDSTKKDLPPKKELPKKDPPKKDQTKDSSSKNQEPKDLQKTV